MMRKRALDSSLTTAFRFGILFFLIGILGFLAYYWQSRIHDLDDFFTDEAYLTLQIDLAELPDNGEKWLKTILQETNTSLLDEIGDFDQLKTWLGRQVGVAFYPDGEVVLAIQWRNREAMQAFTNQYLATDENWVLTDTPMGQIKTPEFSSKMAFGISQRWLMISTSESLLKYHFRNDANRLSTQKNYRSIQRDIPSGFAEFYLDTTSAVEDLYRGYDPNQEQMYQAMAEAVPALGLSLVEQDDFVQLYSKALTHDGIFFQETVARDQAEIIPELVQFVPHDTAFFINGINLPEKYNQLKVFLTELNPQYEIIFSGLIRAQVRELFGRDFDLQKDLLSKMHGQYALILDWDRDGVSAPYLTFLTGFGGRDKEQSLSDLHTAIHKVQSRFVPEIQEVELPDGTVRRELVSQDPDEIPIRKVEFAQNEYYYTTDLDNTDKKFAYGLLGEVFMFSSHEKGLQRILAAKQGETPSLAQQQQFRESVMFRFSPSESYGFLKMTRFTEMPLAQNILSAEQSPMLDLILSSLSDVTFSRKVYPGEIFWSALFWKN